MLPIMCSAIPLCKLVVAVTTGPLRGCLASLAHGMHSAQALSLGRLISRAPSAQAHAMYVWTDGMGSQPAALCTLLLETG